jgi:hypothetical protein
MGRTGIFAKSSSSQLERHGYRWRSSSAFIIAMVCMAMFAGNFALALPI